MSRYIVLLLLLLWYSESTVVELPSCLCKNNGLCKQSNSNPNCICPQGFLGKYCEIQATPIKQERIVAQITSNFTLLYFQPKEANYFKLTFNVCMISNPSHTLSLFYIETERNDGSLRSMPLFFQTAKIDLGQGNCTVFSTNYISIKRRQSESYRKIVIGLKILDNQSDKQQIDQLNSNKIASNQKNLQNLQIISQEQKIQRLSLQMSYSSYIQASYYGTLIILFSALILFLILISFISYLKKNSYTGQELSLDMFNLDHLSLQISRERYYNNPEVISARDRKNNLINVQIFMPMTYYGVSDSVFVPRLLRNNENPATKNEHERQCCSICLIEFQKFDEIRTTPCKHYYHRQCIDDWCENRMSCPICRRQLDFTAEIRKIYYEFLRNQLAL